MPRSRYSENPYSYSDNYRTPPPSFAPIYEPEVPPSILLSLLVACAAILYTVLHAILPLPSLTELVFAMIGAIFGPGARETLQNAFSSGGRSVAEQVRTRAASLVGGTLMPQGYGRDGEGFVGGLWNAGNTCYQNSVLQAMASLSHLKPHLASLSVDEHEDGLNPSGALMELIGALNSLSSNPRAFTPSPIIVRGTDNSGWVYNEQQDAQEFFQKLTGALEKEVSRFLDRRKQGMRKGLEGIVGAKEEGEKIWQHLDLDTVLGKEYRSPFEGLFAQRVGCLRCGYVEAISLQPFTSLSLSLPSSWTCSLEECLDEFTAIEKIEQVVCDKCTLLSLHQQLLNIASKPLSDTIRPQLTARIEALGDALDNDDFNLKNPLIKLSPRQQVSTTKTKQTMIARPPPVLVLHLNRSQYDIVTGMTGKNYAAVTFPAHMDLGRMGVVTRHDVEGGSWGLTVDPARRMSGRVPRWLHGGESEQEWEPVTPGIPGTPETETENETEGEEETAEEEDIKMKKGKGRDQNMDIEPSGESVMYDLKSVVAHYGGHHNGHYVCYRKYRQQWFKISDHEVYACDEQDALGASNAFMLFYERVNTDIIQKGMNGNGTIKAANGYTNGVMPIIDDELETPEDSSAAATGEDEETSEESGETEETEESEETEEQEDEIVVYANGNGNGNGTMIKGDDLLRRRKVDPAEALPNDNLGGN